MIRVFIVDDQSLFLDSLGLYLSQDPDIEVQGTAGDGESALAMIRNNPPDVVLLDLRMPGMNGIQTARSIKKTWPFVRIIVLTTFDERSDIVEAFVLGCEGYILKDVKPADLVLSVKNVARGAIVMHPAAHMVIREMLARESDFVAAMSDECSLQSLTAQELTIVRLVSNGLSNKEIAAELDHTEGTVKNYVSRILQKTGCKDRTQIAIQYLKQDEM